MGHFPRTPKIMNLPSLAPDIQEEMSRPRSWAADSSSCDGSTRASLAIVTDERERPVYAGTGEEFLETHTYFGILIKRPNYGTGLPRVPAHRQRALCPVPNSREVGRATCQFQKLVESGTSRLRNAFRENRQTTLPRRKVVLKECHPTIPDECGSRIRRTNFSYNHGRL
jgi:hypothetical protein